MYAILNLNENPTDRFTESGTMKGENEIKTSSMKVEGDRPE